MASANVALMDFSGDELESFLSGRSVGGGSATATTGLQLLANAAISGDGVGDGVDWSQQDGVAVGGETALSASQPASTPQRSPALPGAPLRPVTPVLPAAVGPVLFAPPTCAAPRASSAAPVFFAPPTCTAQPGSLSGPVRPVLRASSAPVSSHAPPSSPAPPDTSSRPVTPVLPAPVRPVPAPRARTAAPTPASDSTPAAQEQGLSSGPRGSIGRSGDSITLPPAGDNCRREENLEVNVMGTSHYDDCQRRTSESDGGSDWGRKKTLICGRGSIINSAAASAVVGILEIRRMMTAIGRRRRLLDVGPFQVVVGDVRNVAAAALDLRKVNSRRRKCVRK